MYCLVDGAGGERVGPRAPRRRRRRSRPRGSTARPPVALPPAQSPGSLGDLGFDPLGLKPTNDKDLKSMATKELNNGRLAMIGIAGMVAQELVSGMKI